MTLVSFEKDIYPAFTSGDAARICKSLDSLRELAAESTNDADVIFRTFNWSWPALTAKARGGSVDSSKILTRFTALLTTLVTTCSPALIPAISRAKLVIRAIVRGLNFVEPNVVLAYLEAIETHVLSAEGNRGWFLDRAALENLVSLTESCEDESFRVRIEDFIEKVLCTRRIFGDDQLVDLLSRLVKIHRSDSRSASLVVSVLESHGSASLYNAFMSKISFVQLSGDVSNLRRLTSLNFLISIASSSCPGVELPACLSKSELTSIILNWNQNKLVALFSLRLLRAVFARLPVEGPKHRLVDINSFVPVLKQMIAGAPNNHLLLLELTNVVLASKRAFPGTFSECKFDWLKCLDETDEVVCLKILIPFVAAIAKDCVPITSYNVPRTFSRIFRACATNPKLNPIALQAIKDWLLCGTGKHALGTVHGGVDAVVFIENIGKLENFESVSKFFDFFFNLLIDRPQLLAEGTDGESVLVHGLELFVEQAGEEGEVVGKILKKIRRKIAKSQQEAGGSGEEDVEVAGAKRKRSVADDDEEVDLEYMKVSGRTLKFGKSIKKSSIAEIDLVQVLSGNRIEQAVLSLSSTEVVVREHACIVLSAILRALAMCLAARSDETWRFAFREAPQVAMLLTWLRNGVPKPVNGAIAPEPLPLVTTTFVVEAFKVLLDPAHPLYNLVYKHVLGKAAISPTNDIQMWTTLFFAQDAELFHHMRGWVLGVVEGGAEDNVSVQLMIRRGAVEAVLESATQLNATRAEFVHAVRIVTAIVKTIKKNGSVEETVGLVRKFGLCQWIGNVANSKWAKFD